MSRYDKETEVKLEIGPNSYEVRFNRVCNWSGWGDDSELEEDYPEHLEVLVGNTWTPIQSINDTTRTMIEGALDQWLFKNYPDVPDYDGQAADRAMDLEQDR